MHSSIREANLHALLSDDSEVHSHVGNLVEVYEGIRAQDVRGTRLAHMVDAVHFTGQEPNLVYDGTRLRESNLPDFVLAPFVRFLNYKQQATVDSTGRDNPPGTAIHPGAKFLDKFSLRGVQYSTGSCRTRNSHILFRNPQLDACNGPSEPQPGQITHIFLHFGVPTSHTLSKPKCKPRHPDVYICVRPYLSLQPELSNVDQMYRRFGFAGGFLCRRELASPVIIYPSNIISHVAVTPFHIKGYPVLHILPMDRVRRCCLYTSKMKRLKIRTQLMQTHLMDAEGVLVDDTGTPTEHNSHQI
jgi:hypothetical protein